VPKCPGSFGETAFVIKEALAGLRKICCVAIVIVGT
jgi:hypothetical protein